MQIANKILDAGGQLYNYAKNLGGQIVDGLKRGAGIASPGYMYWAVHDELGRMDDVLKLNQRTLGDTASDLGSTIADKFNTNATSNLDLTSSTKFTKDTDTKTTIEVEHTFDLKNVPSGNSDSDITAMLLQGIDNRKVIDKINVGLGKAAKREQRSAGG